MKNIIIYAVACIFLLGCVSTKNVSLPANKCTTLSGKNMVVTIGDKPDFTAMTASLAMMGGAGAYQMIADGNVIVKQNSIIDPALELSSKLSKMIAKKRKMRVSGKISIVHDDELNLLVSKFSNDDYILDVRTLQWAFSHFPMDWDNYRVLYSAKMKFIDVKNKKVVAEGYCKIVPEQTATSPSYDELLANKAQVIKDELKASMNKCIDEFYRKL